MAWRASTAPTREEMTWEPTTPPAELTWVGGMPSEPWAPPESWTVPNAQVDAQAYHATSVNLGLAADSVAQADYDMAGLDALTTIRAASRNGVSIGQGLFAATAIQKGRLVTQFRGVGGRMRMDDWEPYCALHGLPPEWAGIEATRSLPPPAKKMAAVMLYDTSWTRGRTRPRWTYANHAGNPNCIATTTSKHGDLVVWVTLRDVLQGEELTYGYGKRAEDWERPQPVQNDGTANGDRRGTRSWRKRGGIEGPPTRRYRRAAASDTPLTQEVLENLGFVPAWAAAPPAPRERPPTAAAPTSGFEPAWAARRRPANDASRGRTVRAQQVHPYAAPAYGASKVRPDQLEATKALAKRLARDKTSGRIDATEAELLEMATAVAEARADGVNPRTSSKDAFALREFEAYAALRGFDPNLRSEWARQFPERESLKMASWLLWRAQRAIPRSRKGVAKPMSIYQNYLALRRVFKSRDVELTPPGTVRETLRGMIRRFIRRFGIEQLRPKRVEPVTPAMVLKCLELARAGTTMIKGRKWTLDQWTCFVVTAWMVINLSVGSRKGESTKLDGDVDENDWFNRAAVSYCIGGRTYLDPPEHVLRAMKEGDNAALGPKGAKCDQWGTCHGTEPIILPYHDAPDNAARWLRDIELRWPAHGEERRTLPPLP